MTKTEAIQLLGGTQAAAAVRVGVSFQAISNWPEELTEKLRDRVQAVLWRDYERSCQEYAKRRTAALKGLAKRTAHAVEQANEPAAAA